MITSIPSLALEKGLSHDFRGKQNNFKPAFMMLSSLKIAIKPQDRVMFKLLLSLKLWGDSKQKACCFQGGVCVFPNEAILRNGALHSPPCNGSLNSAPVVTKAVLREEQDVAAIHNFDCVFLNTSK